VGESKRCRAELPPNTVQRFVAARVIVNQDRAIGFEHQKPNGFRKSGSKTARVDNLTAGDQKAHPRHRNVSFGQARAITLSNPCGRYR